MTPRSRSTYATCAAFSLLLIACGDTREQQQAFPSGPLKPGVVARAGRVDLPGSLVKDVAQARKVSARDATNLLVEDALLAQAGHDQKLDADPHVGAKVRAVEARMAINQLLSQQPMQPATDEQVLEMTGQLWAQVDRGEGRRTTHAIVLAAKYSKAPSAPDTPEDNAHRLALAGKIRDAVAHASTAAEFTSLAGAVPSEGLQVKVEALPPIVADGRGFDGNSFDAAFAAGVFAVPNEEQLSAVVKSDFGWHVVFIMERLPPIHQSLEERRSLATRLLAEKNLKSSYESHIAELRKQYPVDISTAAESDMTPLLAPPSAP